MTDHHPSDEGGSAPDEGAEQSAADAAAQSGGGVPPQGAPSSPDGDGTATDGTAKDVSPQQGAPTDGSREGMDAFEADVEDSELAKAVSQIDQLGDDLARARADLYNLNQEYGSYVRRSKDAASGHRTAGQAEVIGALVSVFDDIDAARAHGDLTEGPFASIAQKLEETLGSRFGLERFGADGDDFDPLLHEALMAQTSPDVDHPVVKQVLQPGYRMGEKVLRPAKVLVENPE